MDHGSLRDEPGSRSGPPLDHFDQLAHLTHLAHQSPHSPPQHYRYHHPTDLDDTAIAALDLSPFTDPNLRAYAANALASSRPSIDLPSDSPDDPVDPADFYRSYQPAQPHSAQTAQTAQTANAASPLKDPMASAMSGSPARPPHSSLRSNGNGTTPKHPAVPANHRSALRPTHRSASSPVDGRSARPAGAVLPSVKDLKKKFDQSASQPASSGTRKPASRTAVRDQATKGANGRSPVVGSGATSSDAPRSAAALDTVHDAAKASGHRGTQRHQASSNSQSFASRIARPRTAGATNVHGSKALPQLSTGGGSEPRASRGAPPPRQNGLLFGEILPEQSDSVTPGFGIEAVRPRRTSESSIINPVRLQMRSLSDPDIEPPSPTDWYRAADRIGPQRPAEGDVARVPKGQHSRAHSDLAGSRLTLARPADYGAARLDVDSPISPTSPASPTSRLPRLAKRINKSSSHGSPVSTRSNSPSALKYSSTSSGRTSRQHVSSAPRARTPSRNATSRIKPSAQTPGSARKPPPSNISTESGSRLNAYVAVPPPKLSPSLRSSRPRQSVATATTTASRMRAVERGASPLRQSQRSASRPDESTPRRRKVSVGAIDFAQRRETIKLAYSKSIRESQAREARQAAAERRKKELAAVARAKAEAEAATAAAMANAAAAAAPVAAAVASTPPSRKSGDSGRPPDAVVEKEEARTEESREAASEMAPEQRPVQSACPPPEPLRLEIPGGFPGAGSALLGHPDIPLSAVSVTSAVTEFDTEVQTEPPRPESTATGTAAIDAALEGAVPGSSQVPRPLDVHDHPPSERRPAPTLHKKASYQYPFDEDEDDADDSVSIKISLDTSAAPSQPSPGLTPTRATFESNPPGLGREPEPEPEPESQVSASIAAPVEEDDDEYVPRPYTFSETYGTTVTILGPENDFQPLHKELPRTTTAQTDLPQADEPPATGAPENIASEPPPRSGDSQAGVETLDRIEDFYIGPRLRDNVAALRDSTFTSSDLDTLPDGHLSSAEYQKTPDTSHSLTVPALLAPGNRLSQHSVWTDFSFGSEDRDASNQSSASHSHGLGPREGGTAFRIIPSPGDFSTCASSAGDFTQSPETSPLDKSGAAPSPMLPDLPGSQQHLAELITVETLGLRSETAGSETRAPLPEREPPPPPPFEREIERDSTLYLADSRPQSFAHSHDGKGNLSGAASPPRSVAQSQLDSLGPSRVSLSETLYDRQTQLTEQEQEELKRLRQRQLVIRELIDTEDAFIRDMTVVEEIYKGTAEACPNLDGKTVKLIFRNTDEIIAFHAALLVEFKEGASTVYTPKGRRSPLPCAADGKDSDSATLSSVVSTSRPERDDEKDRLTSLGPVFCKNIEQLKAVHEVYLRSSDSSTKRLLQIQEDKTVMLWLNECNEVAKELTTAWNLDSLLIKPMQRITKYPDIITHLLKYTPEDHPDREALVNARAAVVDAIDEINKTKKNFELVGQIVSNRKRKESDVRAGLARAFGKRVDKLQVSTAKTPEDDEYQKLQQQFGDDYLRLQVVLRDVEYYTRNVATYVQQFLQYLSSMELVMRLQPSRDYAHLESKWVQFNVSMRDIEKIALEKHLADVRKHVIEPFEQVIRCYGNPSLAMKKRAKRRLDYEKYMALKANGKKVDKQLAELVEQYEALNDTLKKELPKLSAMTAKIGNICLGKFISIQAAWFAMWKEKVKAPLQDVTHVPEPSEIVSSFHREFALQEMRVMALGIVNPTVKGRASHSTTDDASSTLSKTRSRPSDLLPSRGRGLSVNSDQVPTLPTPEFVKRNSGHFSLSPASSALPSPANYYRDYYSGINGGHARGGSGSPITPADSFATANGPRSAGGVRPGTGRSLDSAALSVSTTTANDNHNTPITATGTNPRDSNSTFNSTYPGGFGIPSGGAGGVSHEQHHPQHQHTRRLSGLFSSALPPPDGPEERSARSSRASSRERAATAAGGGYTVLWLAASLFEFNIETTKHEAGYPYLTYQAGEIFDVIAEKGELWLAKNQDDPRDVVGWIWSKHFAKLADS